MGSIVEDVQAASCWIAQALSSSGYMAEFSPSSLWEIDRFFDEHSKNGQAVLGGLLSEDVGSRLFAIGSYVGEVIRKAIGGEWDGDDSDAKAEINVKLILSNSTQCWPVQRVLKRFKNGPDDGIAVYGHSLGLRVGSKPVKKSKKPWWKVR